MQPSANSPSMDCQVNVRLSREQFESLTIAAQTYEMTPVQYCRAAALAAVEHDLPSPDTPFVDAVAGLLGHVPNDLANLHRDFKAERLREADALSEIALRALAALEEVQGLRTILINTVGVLSRREPFTDTDMDELLATANRFKARNAQRSLHALATRLQAETPPDTPPDTQLDTQPHTQDNANA